MSKKYKQPIKKTENYSASKNQAKPKNKTSEPAVKVPFSKWENFFEKNLKIVFYITLFLTIILGIYLFDVKIHEGGDDSNYIEMAYNFLKGKSFPSWHGEFYSILMSLPILIFGLNVVILKILSFLFIIGHLVFFYLAFKNRVSPFLLALTLLIISVNANILFFSSQTYTEALFLFLQALAIYFLLKLTDNLKENKLNNLELWKYWLLTGFLIFLLTITRNIGITFLIAVIVFFLFTRKFYAIIYSIGSYYIFAFPFQLYKRIFWHIDKSTMSQQMDIILLKNPYNPALGTENLAGMVTRFIENAKIYLSRYFMQTIGLKDPASTDAVLFPAILLLIIFLTGFYLAIRKDKLMLFLSIYLGGSVFVTFVTLSQSWGQLRMIVAYFPLMFLFFLWAVYELSKIQKMRWLFPIIIILTIFIFFKTFGYSAKKAKDNQKILLKNIAGNKYYGLTPDWQNFLKMSEWVGKNIPDSVVVASRKPSMSFIYGKGKEFFPIYRFPIENVDTMIRRLSMRTGPLVAINQNELNQRNIPFMQQFMLKPGLVALVSHGDDVYMVHEYGKPDKAQFENIIKTYNLNYKPVDSLLTLIHKTNKQSYAVSPDTLLNALKQNKVEYVIMASLRAIPNMKTDRVVNTIQRYLYVIEQKYPGIFILKHQIGADNNEPAWLYQINYSMYGMSIKEP
jgi:hypothetical protein